MQSEPGQVPKASFALELWLAHPSDLAEPAIEAVCAALLDDAERARAARFRFARHSLEFLATHALTRVALSHAHSLPPQAWNFSVNKYGKPFPDPECGVHFNQSNSLELAVCLIARARASFNASHAIAVGVDVESIGRAEEIVPLASRVFSAAERAQLEALPIAARPDRALSLWTFKESYIKARGMGLSLPLEGISFLFDTAQAIRLEVAPGVEDDPGRWRFCQFDHAGHRIAMAVEAQTAGPLEVFEVRSPTAPPTRLKWNPPIWF